MTRTRMLALSLTLLLVGLLALPLLAADTKPTIPDGLKNFKGSLTGTVVKAQDDGKGFTLKVTAVKADDGSKATKPESAVGKELLINVQWEKKGDKWQPVEAQVKYVKGLKAEKEVTVSVTNDEGERLHLTEVPK